MNWMLLLLNPPPVPPAPKQGVRTVLGMGLAGDRGAEERARRRARYLANKARVLERQRAYKEAHREEISEKARARYQARKRSA